MSICWKCGKEFVNENNLGTILCYDCASKIPMTTASSQIYNFYIEQAISKINEEISEKEKFIEFCEIFGFKVSDTQMKVFELYNQSKQENKQMFINLGRQQGQNYLNTILINFELWEKDQRIAELEKENEKLKQQLAEKDKLLENAIVPKFKVKDDCYIIITNEVNGGYKVLKDIIISIEFDNKIQSLRYWTNYWGIYVPYGYTENDIFSTKQEAEEALKKLNKE